MSTMTTTPDLTWETATSLAELGELTARWLEGEIPETPSYLGGPDPETTELIPVLAAANRAGFVTVSSQPGSNPGIGHDGATWTQRAAVDGICDLATAQRLVWAFTFAGLWAMAAPARTVDDRRFEATLRNDEPYTFFGSRGWPELAWEFEAEGNNVLREAIGEAYQVTLIDPEYGAGNELWDVLAAALAAEAGPARSGSREQILGEIRAERERQIGKWGEQHRVDDTGGEQLATEAAAAKAACQDAEKHAPGGADWRLVLTEETAEAFAERDPAALRAELVQVAAVAVAWIEDIDSRTDRA